VHQVFLRKLQICINKLSVFFRRVSKAFGQFLSSKGSELLFIFIFRDFVYFGVFFEGILRLEIFILISERNILFGFPSKDTSKSPYFFVVVVSSSMPLFFA